MITLYRRLRSLALTALLTGWMKVHRNCTVNGILAVRAKFPYLELGGTITIGRTSLEGVLTGINLGARKGATLTMGNWIGLNQGASIVATNSITIGDHTLISDYVTIYDTMFHPTLPGEEIFTAPVVIGRNCLIGNGAMIMPGVTIGDNAVVGARTVVSRDVPANSIVAGAPAKVLRTYEPPEGWFRYPEKLSNL
jgi:maltose O-acetyltransferase